MHSQRDGNKPRKKDHYGNHFCPKGNYFAQILANEEEENGFLGRDEPSHNQQIVIDAKKWKRKVRVAINGWGPEET